MLASLPLLVAAAWPAWSASADAQPQPTAPAPFPLQLEVRTPFAPTAFPSNGRTHLTYEIHLTNYSPEALTLRSIEVLDADDSAELVQIIAGDELNASLRRFSDAPGAGPVQIGAGETVMAFMWVSFDSAAHLPARIRHRVNTNATSVEGTAIVTQHTDLRVLTPPVRGSGWTISDGPNNEQGNHHRRGYLLVIDGQVSSSRRFAIDWMKYRSGGQSIALGEPVFAVADATVLAVRDGLPDNTPAPVETFRPALPNSMATIGGNYIALDLGGGQYAWYAHLQPESILVSPGDRVRRGQRLAQIGVSGDSNVPHLHFEVTNSDTLLVGEGLPYVFDRYQSRNPDQTRRPHTRELPLGGMVIDIEQVSRPLRAGR